MSENEQGTWIWTKTERSFWRNQQEEKTFPIKILSLFDRFVPNSTYWKSS